MSNKEFISRSGFKFLILEERTKGNAIIKFIESGYLNIASEQQIKSGDVSKYVLGKAYIKCEVSNLLELFGTRVWSIWINLIRRCYSGKMPVWDNVQICPEWDNFINFAKWHNENSIDGFEMDKDLLSKSYKIYSPITCCFIPKIINVFIKSDKIIVNSRQKGFYFTAPTFGKSKNVIYSNSEKEAEKLLFMYRKTYLCTLVHIYKNQLKESTINALQHYYDNEEKRIFKN